MQLLVRPFVSFYVSYSSVNLWYLKLRTKIICHSYETFLCVLNRNENNENVKSTEILWTIQPVFLLETSKYGIRNLQKFVHGNLYSFRSDTHQTYTKLQQKNMASPNNDSSYKNPSMQHVQNISIFCR